MRGEFEILTVELDNGRIRRLVAMDRKTRRETEVWDPEQWDGKYRRAWIRIEDAIDDSTT